MTAVVQPKPRARYAAKRDAIMAAAIKVFAAQGMSGFTLAAVAKNEVVIVPGLQYKVLTTGGRMVPRNLVRAMTKVVGRGRGRT